MATPVTSQTIITCSSVTSDTYLTTRPLSGLVVACLTELGSVIKSDRG